MGTDSVELEKPQRAVRQLVSLPGKWLRWTASPLKAHSQIGACTTQPSVRAFLFIAADRRFYPKKLRAIVRIDNTRKLVCKQPHNLDVMITRCYLPLPVR